MSFWSYKHLAEVTQGTWLVEPDDLAAEVTGLWHDTREIKQGQAYLAIAGDNFDGHDFIDKAFDAGASLAIVSTEPPSLEGGAGGRVPGHPVLKVNDTIKALQDLARAYRDELKAGGCKVIGIAGSNGKTTTRHLIHHVLTHAGLKGTQSPKSFNNHLGVPLTLLSAKPSDDFVAAEIGTNHPGEIDFLSAIARPDIAAITSIGEEHMEFFKDLDRVAQEEMAICDHLMDEGVVVAGLSEFDQILKSKLGSKHQHYTTYDGDLDPPPNFALLGEHNDSNARSANMVADLFGLTEPQYNEALLSVEPEKHRGEVLRFGQNVTIYDDCYNANPSSMRAAIDTLSTMPSTGKKVAILGDMLELGDRSHELHTEIAYYANSKAWTAVIGPLFAKVQFDMFISCPQFEWSDELPEKVVDLIEPGDTVLLKASRGMRLERLIPAIERRFGPAEGDEPT